MKKITDISSIENKIICSGIIPLIDNKDFNIAKSLCEITFKSGCKIIEFGIRHEDSVDHYSHLSRFVKENSDGVLFGAGSITNFLQAQKVLEIGADFIFSPGIDLNIAKLCNQKKTYYIPGCATVSEILKARSIGCELIKIFPVNLLGGKKFIKTLKGPLPWLKAIPAGGIEANPEIVKDWLNIGAKAVTIGSSLYNKDFSNKNTLLDIEKTLISLMKKDS